MFRWCATITGLALLIGAATLPLWEADRTTWFMAPFAAGVLLTLAYVEWVHWFLKERRR